MKGVARPREAEGEAGGKEAAKEVKNNDKATCREEYKHAAETCDS